MSFKLPCRTRLKDQCGPGKKRFARVLRKNMTSAERIVWERVRGNALGPRFRRQSIIRGWIVDFWCPAAALVVEVDGDAHTGRREADARRDAEMNKLGIRVVRVRNEHVEGNADAVVKLIREVLAQRGVS